MKIDINGFVNGVWRDLRDKRLWPVALVLVLALVAIPVVLAKPAPKGPATPAPIANAGGPAPMVASPASIRSNTGGAVVAGKFKDPFHQQHVPKAAAADNGAASGATSQASESSGSSSDGSGGTTNKSGGTIHTVSQPKTKKLQIRFGKADGDRKTREITPGTPLPGPGNPLIVFTGFGSGGKRPAFLISSDVVKVEGDGLCKPSPTICSTMTIGTGDTEFFDILGGDQYQLDVLKIVYD